MAKVSCHATSLTLLRNKNNGVIRFGWLSRWRQQGGLVDAFGISFVSLRDEVSLWVPSEPFVFGDLSVTVSDLFGRSHLATRPQGALRIPGSRSDSEEITFCRDFRAFLAPFGVLMAASAAKARLAGVASRSCNIGKSVMSRYFVDTFA